MSEEDPLPPVAPAPTLEPGPVLIASLYVEFLGQGGGQLVPRMLGHVPDYAATACATILERIARSMRERGSRIIRPS